MEDKLPRSCRRTFPLQSREVVLTCSSGGHSDWLHHSYPRIHSFFHRYLPIERKPNQGKPEGLCPLARLPILASPGLVQPVQVLQRVPGFVESPCRARAASAFAVTQVPPCHTSPVPAASCSLPLASGAHQSSLVSSGECFVCFFSHGPYLVLSTILINVTSLPGF